MAKNKRSLAYYLGRRGLDVDSLCLRNSFKSVDDVLSFCDSLNLTHPDADALQAALGSAPDAESSTPVDDSPKDDKQKDEQKVVAASDEKPYLSKA